MGIRQLSTSFGLVVGLVASAHAQVPAPTPLPETDSEKGEAKELVQLGVKLVKSKDLLGALAVFKDAHKRFPSAKILLNIGTTLRLLDRNAEAANAYQRYLDSSPADDPRRAEVEAEITRLDQGVGKLAITAPPEAEIRVGNEDWVPSTVGKVYRVAPGPYVLQARRKGFKPFESKGEMTLGQSIPVTVTLDEEPKAVAAPVYIEVPVEQRKEEPRSRIGALALGHFDVRGGAAAFVGAVFDATERVQANAAVIAGPNFGAYVGAHFAFMTGTLRPIVAAGVPIFFNDGARVALRGAAGLEIVANRHFAVIIEVGVEHLLNPQEMVEFGGALRTINSTAFIPALGMSARL
jgi:hypothetical protein